jgi:hypothetical protein
VSPQQSANAAAVEALTQGVNAAAIGRYATALEIVAPYRDSAIAPSFFALVASCYRQLGDHALAAVNDAHGLVSDSIDTVGRADCATGWVADAIGTDAAAPDHLEILDHRLDRAQKATDLAVGSGQMWRLHVRLSWVRAEVDLVAVRPDAARTFADRAVVSSLLHGTQRHLAKSLLIQGVARLADGQTQSAVYSLERAAALADISGLHPLRVPAHGLLAQLADGVTAAAHRSNAEHAADLIATDLPPECSGWRQRPDVVALTSP